MPRHEMSKLLYDFKDYKIQCELDEQKNQSAPKHLGVLIFD